MQRLFSDIANGRDGDFDPTAFAEAFGKFMRGEHPPAAADSSGDPGAK